MPTKVWIGTDGDWNVAGNWSPSGVPATDDTVIIPDGAAALTTNLDRTGDANGGNTGLNLAYFLSSPKMKNGLGSSGTPLKFTADKIRLEGTGTAYFTSATGTAADTTNVLEVVSKNLIDAAVIGDAGVAQLVELDFIKGGATVNATNNAFPEVNILSNDNPFGGSNVRFLDAANITVLNMTGGNLTTAGLSVAVSSMDGGVWTHEGDTGAGIIRQTGGTVVWNVLKTDGSLATLYLLGGTFDSTRTAGEKEVVDLTLFPTGNLVANTDLHLGGTPGLPLGS